MCTYSYTVCFHLAIYLLSVYPKERATQKVLSLYKVPPYNYYVHMYIDTHIQLLINQLDVKLNFHVSVVTLD